MRNLFVSVTCIILIPFLMGCQTERTTTVFGLSQGISDNATDPERLNRELEDTLRQSELKRLEKLQTAPKPNQENRE
ncbi:MAG TPA: hypothetical protein ACFYD6_03445 [Candidatus Brocadiia bacterium]|nr:hypothetical protein [Planctomycetota bacterium]MDO8094287.1 hypothetical protein [Candidatus Brocadiales bacterium]